MKAFTITKNDAGQRLDKFLIKTLKTMPKSLVYKSLRKKTDKGKRQAHDRRRLYAPRGRRFGSLY